MPLDSCDTLVATRRTARLTRIAHVPGTHSASPGGDPKGARPYKGYPDASCDACRRLQLRRRDGTTAPMCRISRPRSTVAGWTSYPFGT